MMLKKSVLDFFKHDLAEWDLAKPHKLIDFLSLAIWQSIPGLHERMLRPAIFQSRNYRNYLVFLSKIKFDRARYLGYHLRDFLSMSKALEAGATIRSVLVQTTGLKEKKAAASMQIQEVFDIIKDDISAMEQGFRVNLNSNVYLVSKVGEYILKSGGKRFRPMVLLLSSRLCGYRGSNHIPLAGVVEFIHTATLLHDDVVDNANLRRGAASANTVWGEGASILVGDYLFSKAFFLTVKHGDMRVLQVLSDTTTRMAEGEVLQLIKHSDSETTEQEYLDVVTNKTAVLIAAAGRVAGILAESGSVKEDALANYGMGLGIAYQLMDDCLDYVSTDEDLGKSVGNDLREGKVTMPLIRASSLATEAERAIIKEAVEGDDITQEQLNDVIAIINRYKGIEYTMERARAYIDGAKKELDIFEPTVERAALLAVADFVIERTY